MIAKPCVVWLVVRWAVVRATLVGIPPALAHHPPVSVTAPPPLATTPCLAPAHPCSSSALLDSTAWLAQAAAHSAPLARGATSTVATLPLAAKVSKRGLVTVASHRVVRRGLPFVCGCDFQTRVGLVYRASPPPSVSTVRTGVCPAGKYSLAGSTSCTICPAVRRCAWA